MRDDIERLRGQRGTFTIAANPAGGIGFEALRIASALGIGTLAIYESADVVPNTPFWEREIVIESAQGGAPTQTPEGKRDVFGTLQALHPSSGALLAYGGGDAMTSVAEAWFCGYSVFVETKFMAPDKRNTLVQDFLKRTHIQTMAHAHVNGYQTVHTSTDPKYFYETEPDAESLFRQNDTGWLEKIGDFLGAEAKKKWLRPVQIPEETPQDHDDAERNFFPHSVRRNSWKSDKSAGPHESLGQRCNRQPASSEPIGN
uniref:Uncharacterized protein n=2 Tax=Pandoraea faecigallinarum TaxID=656179 RepID=A0A0H3WVV5_9BURK